MEQSPPRRLTGSHDSGEIPRHRARNYFAGSRRGAYIALWVRNRSVAAAVCHGCGIGPRAIFATDENVPGGVFSKGNGGVRNRGNGGNGKLAGGGAGRNSLRVRRGAS